eukprot:523411-Hanusia_phi.AAC.1
MGWSLPQVGRESHVFRSSIRMGSLSNLTAGPGQLPGKPASLSEDSNHRRLQVPPGYAQHVVPPRPCAPGDTTQHTRTVQRLKAAWTTRLREWARGARSGLSGLGPAFIVELPASDQGSEPASAAPPVAAVTYPVQAWQPPQPPQIVTLIGCWFEQPLNGAGDGPGGACCQRPRRRMQPPAPPAKFCRAAGWPRAGLAELGLSIHAVSFCSSL